ncbi:hypothetical protein Tco_0460622, partial [Tanacetum coccineum]
TGSDNLNTGFEEVTTGNIEAISPSANHEEVSSQTDQGNEFATPKKNKDSGEAQADQISPSTLEAAQILTNVASEGFQGNTSPGKYCKQT